MSSPSPALRVFDTNPSDAEVTQTMDMEIVPKIETRKRSLVFMELYLNNIFKQMEMNRSDKSKGQTRKFRHNYKFGIFPPMNPPSIESQLFKYY